MQKYRLYLKRVSGVSPSQGRRGLGAQPDWPQMMGPHVGMGMGPAQSPMVSIPPVSYLGFPLVYKRSSLIHFSFISCWQDSPWVLGQSYCVALVISLNCKALERFAFICALHCHHLQQICNRLTCACLIRPWFRLTSYKRGALY